MTQKTILTPSEAQEYMSVDQVTNMINLQIQTMYGINKIPGFMPIEIKLTGLTKKDKTEIENKCINAGWKVKWIDKDTDSEFELRKLLLSLDGWEE